MSWGPIRGDLPSPLIHGKTSKTQVAASVPVRVAVPAPVEAVQVLGTTMSPVSESPVVHWDDLVLSAAARGMEVGLIPPGSTEQVEPRPAVPNHPGPAQQGAASASGPRCAPATWEQSKGGEVWVVGWIRHVLGGVPGPAINGPSSADPQVWSVSHPGTRAGSETNPPFTFGSRHF